MGLNRVSIAIAAVAGGCTDPAIAVFVGKGRAATPETFYDLPYPHDVRRKQGGLVDLTGFPSNSLIVDDYVETIAAQQVGFGLNSGIFMRFRGHLDHGRLPTAEESVADGAAIYLVDVDPDSPERGQRVPLTLRFSAERATSIGPDWLAALPYPGFPLAEETTYALVVTDRAASHGGGLVLPSVEFVAVRDPAPSTDADLLALQQTMQPLWAWLDEPGGDEREDVVTATVFTTQRATHIVPLLRERIEQTPVPVAHDLAPVPSVDMRNVTGVWEGIYEAPAFQRGLVPFDYDGDIVLATDGLPQIQRGESLRFAVKVPEGPTPPDGWPIALYQHGTGGDYLSFVSDGTAERLAGEGIATFSMDQVLHGPRNPGGSPETAFFNFINPLAARDNILQGAADSFSLARMAAALDFTDATGRRVRFDRERLMYFGHSQGSTTGAPYVAYAPDLDGAVLSGAGGVLYLTLVSKTQPIDIPAVVSSLLREEPLDSFNPTLHLMQAWIERADSVNYGPLIARRPPPGITPRPVYVSEGFDDTYTPNVNIEAFAVAIGADLVAPTVRDVDGVKLRGRSTLTAPVTGNLDGTTAVLVQYPERANSDGHFVVFNVPAAIIQSTSFLGTLAQTGEATLVVSP